MLDEKTEWKRAEGNPILASGVEGSWDCKGASFASALYNSNGTISVLYSGRSAITASWEIGLASVNVKHSGGIPLVEKKGRVLEKGGEKMFDATMVYCPVVWRDDEEVKMLYTGCRKYEQKVRTYCVGYAKGNSERDIKRMNNGEPVFVGGYPWNRYRVEFWSSIRVKDVYYHWYSTVWKSREIGYATSDVNMNNFEDQSPAPVFGCGSGYKANRYCPCVFKYGSHYYIILVEAMSRDNQRFAMYRSKEPTFLPEEREFVRAVLFSHKEIPWESSGNIDTPFVVTPDINRDITGQKELVMLFSGYKEKGYEAIGMTVEEDIKNALMPVKTDGRRSLAL